jgi:predicted phosphohydrolase
MKVFAISDLHLGFAVEKSMDIFGEHWKDHPERLRQEWVARIADDDLVLIPGDISWAMKLDEAFKDLRFLGYLPGTKIIIKGNHDYWWQGKKKLKEVLPASIIPLQNTAFVRGDIGIAGTRLWIDPDLQLEQTNTADIKIFDREQGRLENSLKALPKGVKKRIIITHFPPISLEGKPGRAFQIAQEYGCDIWVFGHMHLYNLDYTGFNRTINKTRFVFVSADYLNFQPELILEASE